MKRLLLVLQTLLFVFTSSAQFNGDGYYRVKNVGSERYITVRDNRGSVDIISTSADMGAVELYKGFENVVSDPSSILYIDETSSGYRFHAQGTDTYQIIGYYLKLSKNSDGSYRAYQGNSAMVMYLGDKVTSPAIKGLLSTNAKGTNRDWYVLPFSASGDDNYFGLSPEVKATDAYYASFYASFPFTAYSNGLKVYYIAKVDRDMAVYKEVTNGVVPGAAPVFVKCVSEKPADNRLNIAANSAAAISANQLSGVYFCNDNSAHLNRTAYNAQTMRVLGTDSDGKLAYVKADLDYLPANKSYLNVPAGSPDVIRVISEAEYNKIIEEESKTYTVTFKIGDEVISTQTLKVGASIVVPDAPAKEGYTFSGWGDVPATMPAKNLTFEGSYTINYYTLSFKVGNEVISTQSLAYGAAIVAPDAPMKEGYTFNGWGDVPATMPAKNLTIEGSYTANSYTVTFMIDEEVILTQSFVYGSAIVSPEAPAKEGYTFSGWSDVPATMPARNITIEGTYTVNYYTVIFKIGDEVITTLSLAYGAAIETPNVSKEGHTFNGWGDVPATMPANDLTFEGSFTINYYTVTFTVDEEVISTQSLAYGAAIEIPEVSEKEGYTFSGFGDVPATMPAKNLAFVGVYIPKDYYVLTFKVGDEVIAMQSLAEGDSISVPDAPQKEGYIFDGWGDVPATMPAQNLAIEGTYTANNYMVTIKLNEQVVFSEKLPYGSAIDVSGFEKEGYTIKWHNLLETVPAYNVTIRGTYVANIYTLRYVVDGKVYQRRTVEYGTTISLIAHPEKEGRAFSGWSEVPETMPAHDVEVEGCFMYKVFYYVNGTLVNTEEAFYGSDMPEYVYQPTEDGITFLGWEGETYETMPAYDVIYTANIEGSSVELITADALVDVYTITGTKVMSRVSLDEAKNYLKRGIYIVNGKKMIVE